MAEKKKYLELSDLCSEDDGLGPVFEANLW